MTRLTGTRRLVRLALRRDRIKLPIWILAIIGMVAATVPALEETYGTGGSRITYATTMVSSIVGRAFGVIDGASMGSILMVELSVFIMLLIAFMSTTLVVRHTRHNEETGSAELIGSARVGRYANLTAALLVALIVNAVIGILSGLILSQFDILSDSGAWALGAIFMVTGLTFAAVAAVASQLAGSARGANGIAGAAIALAFLLRAIGDMTGSVEGLSIVSAWPSWLSPLGWGQQVHPFTQQNWWIFGLFASLIAVISCLAYAAQSRRDIGAGILAVHNGPSRASRWLKGSFGIAWRLQRSTFLWWLVVSVVLGVIYGAMTREFEQLISESEVAAQYVTTLGGDGAVADAFLGAMLALTALAVTAYIVQSLLKIRSEEAAGRLEPMLSGAISRLQWITPHILIAAVGATVLLVTTAVVMVITNVLITDGNWSDIWKYAVASLAYIPALMVILGLIVVGIGFVPRLVVAISWTIFIYVMLINQLGILLGLPTWAMDISPFSHVSAVPLEPAATQSLFVLGVVAIVLSIVGLYAFRRRDLVAM